MTILHKVRMSAKRTTDKGQRTKDKGEIMMVLTYAILLLALPTPAGDGAGAFELVDVEAVEGRPVIVYRPIELGSRPVRPLQWDEPPPEGVRFGLATAGPSPETALALAWK